MKMVHKCIFALVFASVALISNINGSKISKSIEKVAALDANSDAYLTPLQLIGKYGYPGEAHVVKSQDGYTLELHRIPYGKAGPRDEKRIPILLHHGLLSSSIDWVINGPNKSLGYRLADQGYDVWLANARGNTFSKGHAKYTPKQKEFWDFSFHEMAIYDLPAAINHILKITGEEQLIYIGYSMGTSIFYVMASTLPEYSKKIKFQISLAPVATIPHTTSAARLLVSQGQIINTVVDWYSNGAFMEHDLSTKIMTKLYCGYNTPVVGSIDSNVCKKYIFMGLFGKDPEQFNDNLLPIISNNFPAGTSIKNMNHCSQLISSGTFSYYDYGKAENIKKYRTAIPPKYKIGKITVPMRLYYGENDLLSNPLDTKLLYQKISKPLGLKRVNFDKFNHVDFLWAKDVNQLLNDDIIEFINNSTDHHSGSDFIQDTVEQALDIRNKTPAPVDVPFDETSFYINISKEFVKDVFSNTVSAAKNVKSTVERKIQKQVDAVVDKLKEKARDLKGWLG